MCQKAEITHVVISPGSRSAPLTLAFASNPYFTCHSVTDERSAAYMALGIARQLKRPVVLVCTSGTAALNYFPAIAEAFFQQVPLIVLTADRPPQLLHQQDGQMIVQKNVYGNHVLASYELPCYLHGKENQKEAAGIMAKAIAASCSHLQRGPVHINIPLIEPLYETISQSSSYTSLPDIATTHFPEYKLGYDVMQCWEKSSRVLVLAGAAEPDIELFTALKFLSENPKVVIASDIVSNQHSIADVSCFDFIIGHADEKLLKNLSPDLLVSIGGPVLSKAVKGWLQQQKQMAHIRIQTHQPLVNTYQNVTHAVYAKPADVLKQLSLLPVQQKNKTWKNLWQQTDKLSRYRIKSFVERNKNSELAIAENILQHLPDGIDLHLANSSTIRYASLLGIHNHSWIVHGNRGTSGIDGCSATAVGAALVNNRLTILLSGDLAFMYDSHAWWIDEIPDNIRVVVINNGGGGIFSLIPGPHINKKQTRFFTTPHKQNIEQITLQYGMEYYFCRDLSGLEQMLNRFFDPRGKAAVLEIKTNMKENAKAFKAFRKIKLL
jgi:2-succinyl-5-enolpyruvyl-6-hydroxy-3-cyclohexene-1-carboxylate synthase